MNLTGIILAGGKSSRMGADKGMMVFNGKKLVEYPLDLLRSMCNELIISSDNTEYSRFDARIIQDIIPGKGPVSGLASSLHESANEWNLVLACDLPYINDALIKLMIAQSGKNLGVVPVHGFFCEPLAALYNRAMGGVFMEALKHGNYSLLDILHSNDVTFVNTDLLLAEYPLLFSNFNTPEDLLINQSKIS